MTRSRAYRRHQKNRAVHHAFHVLHDIWHEPNNTQWDKRTIDDIWDNARYLAGKMKICSCEGCRNPRHSNWNTKMEKLTIQERRHLPDELEFDKI